MNVTKAVIPVAGWGTRRLPITKAIEKCMLPIGNRPVVDYVVQDCIKAGITDIYFVVSANSTQLQAYYSPNDALNEYLDRNNKQSMLPLIEVPNVRFHYIVQPDDEKYGTSIPVSLVASYIAEGESIAVLMGDDCLYRTDGVSEVFRLIEAAGSDCAMLGAPVPPEDVSRYGVIQSNERGEFEKIVEKPQPSEAPSSIINISKYVFTYDLLQKVVAHAQRSDIEGEYQITDPINEHVASGGVVKVIAAEGQYLDSGTVEGWLHANEVVIRGVSL
jgi:UTP--glucose-1-phosphate uridylyltransferase